jgi:AcrR family transcriptional regulator
MPRPEVATADPRRRLVTAAFACVARYGFAKVTVEDVAREAGMSRATVYRHFPGGKDELLGRMVATEMDDFFTRLAVAVADAPDFAAVLERALMVAHRELAAHAVLQTVLGNEPERLLPYITHEQDRILDAVVEYLRPLLAREAEAGRVRPGVDLDRATRYVATMGLSVMATPGRVDLTDPRAVRDLVEHEFLAGILV